MADNSPQNGTDTIRDLARQAGTVKTQVIQLDIGGASANAEVLVTAGQQTMAASLPVVLASNQTPLQIAEPTNAIANGTLSASDAVVAAPIGDGTLISGASTVGSIVAIAIPSGFVAWTLLIKGYVSGSIYTEASTNSTTGTDGDWTEVKARKTGTAVGVESISYIQVANGYYRGNAAGFTWVRARLIGGTGPTIFLYASAAMGATFLNSGIPAGGSVIGKVGIDQTTPGTTNLVSIGTNGNVGINTGTNIVGKFGIDQTTPGTTNAVSVTNSSLPITISGAQTIAAVTAITNALPTGANTIGAVTNINLDVALSTRLKPADTLAAVTTLGTITNALPAGTNKIGTVDIATAPAVAKGTQGSNALPTQDLIDSGRNQTTYFMAVPILTTATDALVALTGYKGGTAVAATVTPAVVTTGKTFRITSITLTYVAIITAGTAQFTIRAQSGGVVTITSPAVQTFSAGAPSATAGITMSYSIPVPDGFEFPAGAGIGVSMIGRSSTQVAAATGYGQISIHGFEY